jgi:hypothetical protein
VLDLAAEIESLPRNMSTSIQQNQVVGMGSPQSPRSAKILGSLHLDAVTAQDAGADVTSALVGVDEENSLVIENRAGTKRRWLIHTKLPKPERVWEAWADSPPGWGASQENIEEPAVSAAAERRLKRLRRRRSAEARSWLWCYF